MKRVASVSCSQLRLGEGTTGWVAANHGRAFRGSDISETWVPIAIDNIARELSVESTPGARKWPEVSATLNRASQGLPTLRKAIA